MTDSASTVFRRWRSQTGVRGVSAGIVPADGIPWLGTSGNGNSGKALRRNDTFALNSITKLFTANLTFRAAQEGLLDLDGPVVLTTMPDSQFDDRLTPRLLLQHRSGLRNYADTNLYASDQSRIVSPEDAIRASLAESAQSPGGNPEYSSVNFLILGKLLEEVRGVPFEDLLMNLMTQLQLTSTVHLAPSAGHPNFSTGGLVSTTNDLLRIGQGLLRDGVDLTEEDKLAMRAFDLETGIGPGLIGYCPCTTDETGARGFTAVGQTGSTNIVVYVPSVDRVIAVQLSETLFASDRFERMIELLSALATATPN